MDNKDILEETLNAMNPLSKMCETLMSQMPQEVREALPSAQVDMNKTFESLRSGDTSKINEILNKYANVSSVFMKKH